MTRPPNVKTQSANILRLLTDAHGAWVSLPEIMALAAQYNARIFELRKQGFSIENRTEVVGEARHSWFRIANSPTSPAPTPPKPESAKSEVAWPDRKPVTGLPLWDSTVLP